MLASGLLVSGSIQQLTAHSTGKTWAAAKAHCASLGTRLVSIHSSADQTAVMSAASSMFASGYIWAGGSDSVSEGAWKWEDGTSFWSGGSATGGAYANWNSNEPNDGSGNEDCLLLNSNGKWNDGNCAGSLPFLCGLNTAAAAGDTWVTPVSGSILYSITTLSEFLLSFEVKPLGTVSGWGHLVGIGEDPLRYPSVFFHDNERRLRMEYRVSTYNTIDQLGGMSAGVGYSVEISMRAGRLYLFINSVSQLASGIAPAGAR